MTEIVLLKHILPKMKIENIITERGYQDWPSFDLVYEWEDIIADKLNIPLFFKNKHSENRFIRRIPFIKYFLGPKQNSFIFEMSPITRYHIWNKKNIIPYIIDFYLQPELLKEFYIQYKKNPIIFISSKEVFLFLKQNCCPLNIIHLPLSIPDKYKITEQTIFDKEYDLVMAGRQNPILEKYAFKYAELHKDFKFVYRKLEGKRFLYYTSENKCLGDINTREKYIQIMKKSKCGLYSTPGIDGGEQRTNGFNQVTPRFLELLACGCHVIARYKENADTDFYKLKEFSHSINTYEEFEKEMDLIRNKPINLNKYVEYLSQHYTSTRIVKLKQIVEKI